MKQIGSYIDIFMNIPNQESFDSEFNKFVQNEILSDLQIVKRNKEIFKVINQSPFLNNNHFFIILNHIKSNDTMSRSYLKYVLPKQFNKEIIQAIILNLEYITSTTAKVILLKYYNNLSLFHYIKIYNHFTNNHEIFKICYKQSNYHSYFVMKKIETKDTKALLYVANKIDPAFLSNLIVTKELTINEMNTYFLKLLMNPKIRNHDYKLIYNFIVNFSNLKHWNPQKNSSYINERYIDLYQNLLNFFIFQSHSPKFYHKKLIQTLKINRLKHNDIINNNKNKTFSKISLEEQMINLQYHFIMNFIRKNILKLEFSYFDLNYLKKIAQNTSYLEYIEQHPNNTNIAEGILEIIDK